MVFRLIIAGTVVAYSIAVTFLIVFIKNLGSECEKHNLEVDVSY